MNSNENEPKISLIDAEKVAQGILRDAFLHILLAILISEMVYYMRIRIELWW